ncbi:scavenger receptor cysteine-rich type 1 protein M130-like isoform X2 [Haliotis rufescens]|uniref:scavenger receptor cysteine-rich type 1 protein M130-like isoform X2 n=1 Tax=Haliotis rufescens TaxID=6454 RepID=UPI00201F47C4|nr:scavenger receptor cysteine-rich type 1 protein M130-like isoform X2 [Haliotis rufescens]
MAKWITADIILLACISFSVSVSGQTIRLVSPLSNGVGRIEVFYNGTWGTVCDDGFGADEAKVACKQLGRYKSGLTPRAIETFGFGGGKIWLDGVSCSGTESSLASCSHNTWGDNDCSHGEDVGIICDPSDITMKLTPNYNKGLLQVYHSGRWGTVCDDEFGQIEASVVCRALGYQGGKVIDNNSSITMWLDDVQCTMRNTDLKDCKHRPWGSDDCSDSEAVGVQCFSFPEDSTAARLVSTTSTPGEGVLELYHGGQWGRVCYTGFGVEEATVVCRMLGHSTSGALASLHLNTGSSSRHVILDKVKCLGTELSLNECLHYPWGSVTCSSSVARIQCLSANLHIRLNSTTLGRGRVEVLHNNVWGTVCRRSSFSSQEAQVVCKMANLPWTTASVTTSYGPGEGIIWLSNVDCTGTETSLDQCSHSGWGTAPSCSHSSDVGVVCRGAALVIHLEPPGSVLNVLLGQVIGVVCVVDYSNSTVTSFRWTHNGHPYSGQTFSKTVTSKSDSGSLTCSVGNVHASTRINVWYPTVVHLEPRNDTLDVDIGEDLSVRCVVDDGNPSVHTVRWSHNGQTVTGHGSTFLKRNITKSDQGELACTADNGHMMTPGRAVATVNVRYPPEIHLSPRQDVISVMAGDAVEVECVVDDANPAVTSYTWCHNDYISHGQTFMKHVSPDDAGNLSCSATNEQGTSTVQARIRVLQVSSFIGSDDTISQNKLIAIVTGSVGIVTIIILIIIVIHLRRRLHAAKSEHEPKRSEQTSRTDEIPSRCCNYETVERPSGGPENTYCEIGLSQTTDGNPAHVYGNTGFEDEENIRKKKGTASGTNYGNIQLEMSENIRQKRGKERKVKSPKGQAYNDEPVYQNTTSREQSSM